MTSKKKAAKFNVTAKIGRFKFVTPKTTKKAVKPVKTHEPVFTQKENRMILEGQRLRKKIRILQAENRELKKSNEAGNVLVANLRKQIEALTPPPAPVVFTPPQLSPETGPTVPATVAPPSN